MHRNIKCNYIPNRDKSITGSSFFFFAMEWSYNKDDTQWFTTLPGYLGPMVRRVRDMPRTITGLSGTLVPGPEVYFGLYYTCLVSWSCIRDLLWSTSDVPWSLHHRPAMVNVRPDWCGGPCARLVAVYVYQTYLVPWPLYRRAVVVCIRPVWAVYLLWSISELSRSVAGSVSVSAHRRRPAARLPVPNEAAITPPSRRPAD